MQQKGYLHTTYPVIEKSLDMQPQMATSMPVKITHRMAKVWICNEMAASVQLILLESLASVSAKGLPLC